jgi:hypothetical protein
MSKNATFLFALLLFLTLPAKAHDIYRDLRNPSTNSECCHDKDCRATDYRPVKGGYEFWVDDVMWVFVPDKGIQYKFIPGDTSKTQAHWCGEKITAGSFSVYMTYCAILPPPTL